VSSEDAPIGHNSAISKEARDRLKSIIDRIENLEADKKGLSDDIKDIKAEAKGAGFDVKVINTILKLRKRESSEVVESTMILETYCRALGMSSYLE
jgi:uncharacterized protein (UPF0335 family)